MKRNYHVIQAIAEDLENISSTEVRKMRNRIINDYIDEYHLDYSLEDLYLEPSDWCTDYFWELRDAIEYDYGTEIFSDLCDEILSSIGLDMGSLSDAAYGEDYPDYEYLTNILYTVANSWC